MAKGGAARARAKYFSWARHPIALLLSVAATVAYWRSAAAAAEELARPTTSIFTAALVFAVVWVASIAYLSFTAAHLSAKAEEEEKLPAARVVRRP